MRRTTVPVLGVVVGLVSLVAAATVSVAATTLEPETEFVASDTEPGDHFSLGAIDGDVALMSAPGDDDRGVNAGAAYVFEWQGGEWVEVQKLTASDGQAGDRLGRSALDGDTAVVTAQWADGAGVDAGVAYVFRREDGVWVEEQKLTASDAAGGARFGRSVALDGDTVVVGAPGGWPGPGTGPGAAYVFTRSDGVWTEQQKLVTGDVASYPHDQLGQAVAVAGDVVFVSHPWFDKVHVFVRNGGEWIETQRLTGSTGRFGLSIAVDGDTAVIGDGYARGGRDFGGAVYVFTAENGTWHQQQRLVASDGLTYDTFGASVDVAADVVIVGAPFGPSIWHGPGISPGAAYVFVRYGSSWSEVQKIVPVDGENLDRFGGRVGIGNGTVLIGAAHLRGWGWENSGVGAVHSFRVVTTPNDPEYCGALATTIVGTEDDDVIEGTDGPDVIAALGGNDVVNGGDGDDVICGGDGDDALSGGGDADVLWGGHGEDVLVGGAGFDELSGEAGNDRLVGGGGPDRLFGGPGADLLNGGAGSDLLKGGEGHDRIFGYAGDDRGFGGPGWDRLIGGSGTDVLNGQSGDDLILGQQGDDTLIGASGRDTLVGGAGTDNCSSGEQISLCEP